MLKKKDLVKQFELVVQQEIIEHNKAVSTSNLAINKLGTKIDELKDVLHKNILNLRNDLNILSMDQHTIESLFDKIKDSFQSLRNDQFIIHERNYKDIETIDQSVEMVQISQQKSDKRIALLEKAILFLEKALKEILKDNECEKERVSNKIIKEVKKLKEEILSIPSKSEEVKKEFMEELSMHKIDNKGLLKEIKILKKTVFINEKKIEHLNTMIERMNKKLT